MAIWWAEQCWVRCGSFVRGQRPFVTGVFITAQCLNTNFLSPPLFVTIDLFALLTFFYCGTQVQEAPHIYKGWGQKPQLRESWLGVQYNSETLTLSTHSTSTPYNICIEIILIFATPQMKYNYEIIHETSTFWLVFRAQ